MSDILDLIDGAIRGYAVSDDAMRWTGEGHDIIEFVEGVLGQPLQPWQRRLVVLGSGFRRVRLEELGWA